jgi:hypothetical protein
MISFLTNNDKTCTLLALALFIFAQHVQVLALW